MKPVALLCQNGAFGRAALSALGAHWPAGFDPALVIEGPSVALGQSPMAVWPLQLRATLGMQLTGEQQATPVMWARRFGAQHVIAAQFVGRRAVRRLRQQQIETLVCLGYPTLLDDEVLGALALALNAHPSLLPRFRGPSPLFWWLRRGGAATGVSVHHMVKGADRGDIVAQQVLHPAWQMTGRALAEHFGQVAGLLLAQTLARSHTHRLAGRAQSPGGSWAPRPRPEDAIVEPHTWPGQALLRFCCGAPYWKTPRIAVGGSLFFARAGVSIEPGGRLPGDFVQYGELLEVQAADGTVSLQVQRPG